MKNVWNCLRWTVLTPEIARHHLHNHSKMAVISEFSVTGLVSCIFPEPYLYKLGGKSNTEPF